MVFDRSRMVMWICGLVVFSLQASDNWQLASAQEKIALRYQFAEGDEFNVQLGQVTTIQSDLNKNNIESTEDVTVWMNWKVDSIKSGNATMTWKFNRVKSRFSTIKKTRESSESPIPDVVEFDTDETAEPEKVAARKLWKGVQPLLGQPFQVVMNDRGQVESVTIPDDTMEVLRNFSGSMRVRRLMTDDGIREILGQTACIFPEQEVAKGEGWSFDREFEIAGGQVQQKSTYTFQGASESESGNGLLVEVKAQSDLNSTVDDGRPRLEILEQDCSGQLWLDEETNIVTSGKVTSNMKTVSPYRNMQIKAEMSTELTIAIQKQ